ncbi:MAG: hypothetical protein KKC11_01210 [Candidatus Omnitrophica bacterium]|nr:hypothetical protein [Candidatus Omnitrophota bacterium]MBU0878831.1 hypothetical protein [Candidatus Omnitrophota bacterium]MBU1367740.1 hypothetical protein [Candidatus Omnitrophota bacterium]MBU1810514.1 hypothetical protein [Candidatus Omnitrophota bacterium]MBU2436533.1 hypothetical protein [Candidatus Omnitrophota bacterium]
MVKTLIKSTKYDGKYVALEDFDSHKVVGDGKTPREAYDKAIAKGYLEPVIVFAPIKGRIQIY